jgi:hypothetical protein
MISEEAHFDVVLGRSWVERMNVKWVSRLFFCHWHVVMFRLCVNGDLDRTRKRVEEQWPKGGDGES